MDAGRDEPVRTGITNEQTVVELVIEYICLEFGSLSNRDLGP